MQSGEKPRMTASERDALMALCVASEAVRQHAPFLQRRARMVQGMARDLGMIQKRLQGIVEACKETMPENQQETLIRSLAGASYVIGMKCPATRDANRTREYGIWLPYEVINGMLDGLREVCSLCVKDADERRKCPLRKTLDQVPNDVREDGGDGCPYYGVM